LFNSICNKDNLRIGVSIHNYLQLLRCIGRPGLCVCAYCVAACGWTRSRQAQDVTVANALCWCFFEL